MSKTVIVTCHPYAGSFCHALMVAAAQGAKNSGQDVDVIDLEAEQFDPVMHSADLIGFLKHQAQDEQARDYIRRLQDAEHLILVFPIWWELMPAMMKGFIDKVIFPGETFDYTANGTGMRSRLNHLQATTIITTMNTPKALYRWAFGNAIQRALIRGTFKKMGLKHIQWLSCNMVKTSTDAKRQAWLQQATQIGARQH
ncbi:MAG: NAD(P)H-dependent oxidoreductase [Lactobacillus sp.]|jgi:putative NADPH-quinone reductase|nr:NAD(P)H-dependent oxidoreductase [Lactobacillus sp.]MCI2031943.1 NAD(P)H-dependent oxidoreductase [Lactobacillus sp.]